MEFNNKATQTALTSNLTATTADAAAIPENTDAAFTGIKTEPRLDDKTIDLIYGMKLRGQQRPPEITEHQWDSVVIKQTLSMSFVAADYRLKLAKAAADKLLGELPQDDKGKITALHDVALDQLVGVLMSDQTKDAVKLQAATYIIDHNVGKAKQEIEHSGSLALEIRAQARKALALEQASMRDVSPKQTLDKPLDVVDSFLERHMSDNFIVGKKEIVDEEQ
jgi:hypothetical protein